MGNVQLASVGTDVVFKIAVGVGGQLGFANQGHGHIIDHAQKLKVFQWFVRQLAVQGRRGSHANVEQQQCMAIWVGTGHLAGTNRTAGTCHVFDHEIATWHGLGHGNTKVTGNLVGGATRSERHHDGNRL